MATSLINTECKRYGCMKNLLACYANCRYSTKCDDLRNEVISKTEQASTDINKYLSEHGRKPITIQFMKRGLKFSEATAQDVRSGNKAKLASPIKASTTEPQAVAIKSIARTPAEPPFEDKAVELSPKVIKKIRKRSAKTRPPRLAKSREPGVESTAVKVSKTQGTSYLEKSPVGLKKKKAAKQAKQKPRFSKAKKMMTSQRGSPEKLATFKMRNRKSAAMPRRPKNESNPILAEKEQVLNSPAPEQDASANNRARVIKPARSKKRPASTKGRSAERNGKVFIILEGKTASVVDEQGLMMHLFTNPSSSAKYFEASEVEARVQIIKK
jgi:hypothetical protein